MKFFGIGFGFFCAFFTLGWFLAGRSPGLKPQSPVPPVSAPMAPLAKTSVSVAETNKNRQLLLKGKGSELFTALFDQDAINGQKFSEMETALKTRFAATYPKSAAEFQRELVSRLGILKALAENFREGSPEKNQLTRFYQDLALKSAEPMMVRRQALRNLLPWVKMLPEKKRALLLARMPAALRASAPYSESELAEEIFSHAK